MRKGVKLIIQQSRPKNSNNPTSGFDQYGMPSGHSQLIGFFIVYIYLVIKNIYWLQLYGIFGIITLTQRIYDRNHTSFQVLIGFIIGCLMAFSFYKLAEKYIQTKNKENTISYERT